MLSCVNSSARAHNAVTGGSCGTSVYAGGHVPCTTRLLVTTHAEHGTLLGEARVKKRCELLGFELLGVHSLCSGV